jgi:hypothetical protein
MNLLYSIFFGAGAAAIAYTRLGRRAGYSNTQNVWTIVGVIFVLSTIVFFTILSFLPGTGGK